MAILIVGGESQVALQIAEMYGQNQCLTTSRRKNADRRVDLFVPEQAALAVSEICDRNEVSTIIIAAGATNVDWCETHAEEAYAANSHAPRLIAKAASARRIRVVYFSTDYVFDGDSGPYDESAKPNPINVYGQTKLLGEAGVMEECASSLVVRSTWVYGEDPKRRNFMYRVLDHDYAESSLNVSGVEQGSPTWNKDLAVATFFLVRAGCEGCFHVAGPEQMTRLQFAGAIRKAMGGLSGVRPNASQAFSGALTRRPVLGGLVSERLPRVLPSFNSMDIQSVLDQLFPINKGAIYDHG